jgi:hypothetical protein
MLGYIVPEEVVVNVGGSPAGSFLNLLGPTERLQTTCLPTAT